MPTKLVTQTNFENKNAMIDKTYGKNTTIATKNLIKINPPDKVSS